MKDHITIAGHDSAFAAYIARPKTVPAPAVIDEQTGKLTPPLAEKSGLLRCIRGVMKIA